MKITKVPKRLAEALPQVQDLLRSVLDAADDELPDILDGIIDWCWPRGDLHYWVPVLNRFDVILEETCRDYDLHKLQVNEFTPMRKRIVISVLHFSRLLIENSTSRKLYNSYEHLNTLLLARDVDILEATLRLLLRFAQQQSSQQPRAELAAAQQRLSALAVAWPPRDLGISNLSLAKSESTVPSSLKHVRFQVYHSASTSSAGSSGNAAAESSGKQSSWTEDNPQAQTPTRSRAHDRSASGPLSVAGGIVTPANPAQSSVSQSNEGLTTVDLGKLDGSSHNAMDILADAVEAHGIPREDRLEFFQRIRLAVSADNPRERHQLLVCRLLALACYAHVTSESLASAQLFLFEPDVVHNTAELVKPEHKLDQEVVSAALYALDALGRYRSKLHEVLSSLSASVNHGVLMQVLRNIIDDLATGKPKQTDLVIDAFYGLASFTTSTSSGSSLIVGAGLVQLLVQLLDKARPQEYIVQRTMTRTLGLLDSLVYAYPPAFELFCQGRGLDVLVRRIEEQVDYDIQNASVKMEEGEESPDAPYGRLTYGRAHLLRAFLHSIMQMMVSTGTADGLRNLIDTSLTSSIKKIMEHRRIFGPQNLALAINLMATFVHNEPTTLGVIQEKKLPETFLNLVKDDIEAHFDVINAIPNAVGALCLNQAGLDLFSSEPILARLLSLLTSERHIKVLTDQENITTFGGAIDELIRHQPTLKQSFMEELLQVLKTIHVKGNEFKYPEATEVSMYELSEVSPDSLKTYEDERQKMKITPADLLTDENDTRRHSRAKQPNDIAIMMELTSHFLETLFQSTSVCKDFLKTNGLDLLLQFYDLPCLSFNFATSPAADALVHLLQFVSDFSPNTVVHAVLRQLKASLNECFHLWSNDVDASNLLLLNAPDASSLAERNADFRKLIKLNARVQLFADVTSAFYFTQSKTMMAFLQVLNGDSSDPSANRDYAALADLANFQHAWCWQSIIFKARAPALPSDEKDTTSAKDPSVHPSSSGEGTENSEQPRDVAMAGPASDQGRKTEEETGKTKVQEPLLRNVVALRCIVGQIREAMTSIFADTVRLLNAKRITDTTQKRTAASVAAQIGKALHDYLMWHPHDNAAFTSAYAECATREATKIMYEDRSGRLGNVQAAVLVPFIREGGLDRLVTNFEHISTIVSGFFDKQGKPIESHDLDTAVHMSISCSAMRTALRLFHQMSSSKALLESPSTTAVSSKDDVSRASSNYFNPREALIDFRAKILPTVVQVWEQNWLLEMPISSLRLIVQIIVRICEATGEEIAKKDSSGRAAPSVPGESTSLSALPIPANGGGGLTAALAGALFRSRSQAPDETRINQLIDMGFSRRAATHALSNHLNNVSAATEYLLSHPEAVNEMADDEESQAEAEQSTSNDEQQTRSDDHAVEQDENRGASNSGIAVAADPSARPSSSGSANISSNGRNNASAEDVDMNESDDDGATIKPSETDSEEHEMKKLEARRDQLNKDRETVLGSLVPRALVLADRHDVLIFDVKAALFVASDGFRKSELLVNLIKEIEGSASTSLTDAESMVSNRLHLLALTLNDSVVTVELSAERAKQMMVAVKALLDAHGADGKSERTPKWTASLLLVLAAVLRADYHIPPTEVPEKNTPSQDDDVIKLPSPNLFEDSLPMLLDYTIQRLQNLKSFDADDLLAFYRFIVLLTRKASTANDFTEKDGINLMMKPFQSLDAALIEACRPHAMLVMRNIIESNADILRQSIKSSLIQWFKQQRSKTIDTSSMSRGLSSVMLRDPDMFLEVARAELHMIDYSVGKGQGFLKLSESLGEKQGSKQSISDGWESRHSAREAPAATAASPSKDSQAESKADSPKSRPSGDDTAHDKVNCLINFLVFELQRGAKEIISPAESSKNPSASQCMELDKTKSSDETEASGKRQFLYVSFLLQSLAELLSSYPSCKTAFLHYSKKRLSPIHGQSQTARKETPAKPKQTSSILQYFLGELVPVGFVRERGQEDMRRAMSISNWSMSVIVALCADVPAPDPNNDESATARKSIADALIKCFKDATGQGAGRAFKESTEARFGRLYSLSDLCYRLFTANPNRSPPSSPFEESTIQFVKALLERNFVSVLTSAAADVDLNMASSKSLIEKVLKPLEHLTKIANMMNKAERQGDKHKARHNARLPISDEDESEIGLEDEMSEDGEGEEAASNVVAREETPDFYRNSSLGMHTGDLEGAQSDFEEDDEDEDDEDEDEEMEDGMHPGAEYDDMTSDDSESDDDVEEHIVEIMDERDDSEEESTDEEDVEDDSDEEDDEEGSWIDEDDDAEHLEEEEGEALDFVLDGGDDHQVFAGDEHGPMFAGDDGIYNDANMSGPILIDGDAEDDEEGEDMDEEEGESMIEEAFEEELGPIGIGLPGETSQGGPVDRFGANWTWANGASTAARSGSEAQGDENVSPFAFLRRQRPHASRHHRNLRRLMDWDSGMRAPRRGPHGGPLISGIGAEAIDASHRDVASHPLLAAGASSGVESQGAGDQSRARPQSGRRDHFSGPDARGPWARSIEELMSGGAMQVLETLLNRNGVTDGGGHGRPQPIQISLTNHDGMPRMSVTGAPGVIDLNSPSAAPGASRQQQSEQPARETDLVTFVQDFSTQKTTTRWAEAMRILHGPLVDHRLLNLRNYVIRVLRSGYLVRQEEQRKKRADLEEEKRKNTEELEKVKREKERVEQELQDARAQFEEYRHSQEQARRSSERDTPAQALAGDRSGDRENADDTDMEDNEPHADSADAAATAVPANLELGSLQQGLDELDASARTEPNMAAIAEETPAGNSSVAAQEPDAPNTAASEQSSERVTTIINGAEVDITGSGIDPTFLEALPEDMREEVLNQHFRERRVAQSAIAVSSALGSTDIAPEFLNALPPEIRDEVIQQEAIEQHRRQIDQQQRRGDAANAPEAESRDMDSADFLATLDPHLRSAILQDGDPSFLESLPSGVHEDIDAAQREAARRRGMRDNGEHARSWRSSSNGARVQRETAESGNRPTSAEDARGEIRTGEDKKKVSRDAIQLLDKSGIAALVRLMFLPQLDVQQSGLRNVLANLSENNKTRVELLNFLLLLLAENMGRDGAAPDRGIAVLNQRASKAVQSPARPTAKRSTTATVGLDSTIMPKQAASVTPLSRRTGDDAPFLVALRSIDMLLHLTSTNERAAHHFLRDDGSNGALMRWFARNTGSSSVKGKERSASTGSTLAPVNILLVLLGRRSILENAQLVDGLIALLNTVTRPLPIIAQHINKAREADGFGKKQQGESSNTATTSNNAVPPDEQMNEEEEGVPKEREENKEKETAMPSALPHILDERVAAIVKPLSTSISSKGFQHTLAVASHLAVIDGARDVITEALHREASIASQSLLGELDTILETLPEPPAEVNEDDDHQEASNEQQLSGQGAPAHGAISANLNDTRTLLPQAESLRIDSPALTDLASPSSSQTVILRSLRALEWVLTRPSKASTAATIPNQAHQATSARMHRFAPPIFLGDGDIGLQ